MKKPPGNVTDFTRLSVYRMACILYTRVYTGRLIDIRPTCGNTIVLKHQLMNTGTSAERCSEAERQLQLVVIVITTERHCGDEVGGGD
jgi:hypothetical protein